MEKYLTLHGHFYQPPRENPWTEVIDRQPSAHPEHDWNERINAECYFPNAFARILDDSGRITEIINNYTLLNFNFGPTLLSWLEIHAPRVYKRVLEADQESMEMFNGHGAAIAQCYNHTIMPLAPIEDQRTQILWGVADFKHRFQREPESIWLPETAINQQTFNLLTDFPFKYIILSPHQAQRVRPLPEENGDAWRLVDNGQIDMRRPYRCFAQNENGEKIQDRFIDVFFYHGDLSRGISFERLLHDSKIFATRLEEAFGEGEGDLLISTATDGETFGHHQEFGEMAAAYLLHNEAPLRGMKPINFGAFLEKNPPQFEAELKPGPDGEGTAWSCAHGVGRWTRDCGCNTGGEMHWNQSWRQPLRDALDFLRDELNRRTAEIGEKYFKDVDAARNAYIDVILDRESPTGALERFLTAHTHDHLEEDDIVKALKVMEMQRNMQLMYTSCGWFFSELSGIETVQVMKYAARAIQLGKDVFGEFLESPFLEKLKLAKSNIRLHHDGEWIYNNFVKPRVVTFGKVINHFAITSMFKKKPSRGKSHRIYTYHIDEAERHSAESENAKIRLGFVHTQSHITLEKVRAAYVLLNLNDGEEIVCFVKRTKRDLDFSALKISALQLFSRKSGRELIETMEKLVGGLSYTLGDLFYDERQKIVDIILTQQLREIGAGYREIFDKYRNMLSTISNLDLPLPESVMLPAKLTLGDAVAEQARRLKKSSAHANFQKALDAVRLAEKLGIELDTQEASQIFQKTLEKKLLAAIDHFDPAIIQEIANIIDLAKHLKLSLHQAPIQNRLFSILRRHVPAAIMQFEQSEAPNGTRASVDTVLRLAQHFNINVDQMRERFSQTNAVHETVSV